MNGPQKDLELVNKLTKSTLGGKTKWQATAQQAQYVASFKGKWSVLVDEYPGQNYPTSWSIRIQDADGTEMLRVNSEEYPPVEGLYEAARRSALNVDEAINDILKDLDKDPDEEIPF